MEANPELYDETSEVAVEMQSLGARQAVSHAHPGCRDTRFPVVNGNFGGTNEPFVNVAGSARSAIST
jgi:hypothetical protein